KHFIRIAAGKQLVQKFLLDSHVMILFLSIIMASRTEFLTVPNAATGRPVAMILRPGKTPADKEICAASSGASAPTGLPPASWSAAMATMAGRKSWPGAMTMRSTTSSACQQGSPASRR
ncbi:hypothetical protein, partial [Mesorhizobium sp.]|uniref:hypothetical protein n=1 Tax=Mesorhizobium sp. TaxID=1871066 RepID=UPI00257FA7D7